jgi:glutamate formiminotransferase/formiminotetrahydrofolate cyclodeaminase
VQLIECVPNFSEGRNPDVIGAITAEIEAVTGIQLLDVDPGVDTNRTVVTFVGDPTSVAEAAYRAIVKAAALIDMRNHHGAHPRMGATDVCPFVPVVGVTMEECVELARSVAARVGDAGIPVYLYEHAAQAGRRSLADVRRGEYEALAERADRPDLGPDRNDTAGATAIGAREFLIAYNVNLNTTSRRLAHEIAQSIRELGAPRRDGNGRIVKNDDGETIYEPGRFRECKAMGWYLEDYGRAQVSINLTNYKVTSIQDVFEACVAEAAERGMRVTGSELVGLVPEAALLEAGDYFLARQDETTGVPEADRIRSAVLSLGLAELGPFDPGEKVIEYRVSRGRTGLTALSTRELLADISSDSPAPGGGSVAALCGALAAALTSMVAALTFNKKGRESTRQEMETLGRSAQTLMDWFRLAVDRDTDAFNAVITAVRLPKSTAVEKKLRDREMSAAALAAATVPLEVLEHAVTALQLSLRAARDGNPGSVSDAGVAAACAEAAAWGASLNVRINLPSLAAADQDGISSRHDAAMAEISTLVADVRTAVDATLER